MGLITPIELPEVDELGAVHFVAIGGSGMNGIASMMLAQGIPVSGSDRQDSKYLRSLEAQGARVYVGHRAEQLGDAATVVASSAIRDSNPELAEARRTTGTASQCRSRFPDVGTPRYCGRGDSWQDDDDGDDRASAQWLRI